MTPNKKSRETILILHGWGSSKKSWEKTQADLVERGYQVIVPDFPGFGESEAPPKPWTGEDYLNWLLEFIKKEEIESPFYLAGHSFGGGLAMKLAINRPGMIKGLILVAAARTKTKRSLKKRIFSPIAKIGRLFSFLPFYETLRKGFYKLIVREKDYVRTKGVMRETMKLIIQEDVTPEIHRIKAPTLIIWGDNDKATPVENAYLINREIKNSKLHVIPSVGHAVNLERPHELAELIDQFIG